MEDLNQFVTNRLNMEEMNSRDGTNLRISAGYVEENPPSQRYMQLQDVEDKHLQPGVATDGCLMINLKSITKIDWKNDESLKTLPSLPVGDVWTCLSDLVGDGKHFRYFHHTGLLLYLLMNKKYNSQDCSLTNFYKTYPPASWRYAFMCANECRNIYNQKGRETLVSHVVYIGNVWLKDDEHELLLWIRNQGDTIIELGEETNATGDKNYVFQFALGDDMVSKYSTCLADMNLLHNVPIDVPKAFKREILNNIQAYNNTNTHHITVKSTFPFTAINHKSFEHRGKGQELQFMEVMAKIEIAFGSSNQGGLNEKLLCNPCFMGQYYSYTMMTVLLLIGN